MAWEWLAPTVAGCVGVAGIAGTVWGASAGRRAQLDVARVQAEAEIRRRLFVDKRDLYARVLHHLEEMALAAHDLWRCNTDEAKAKADLAGGWGHGDPNYPAKVGDHVATRYRQQEAQKRLEESAHILDRLRSEIAVVAGSKIAGAVESVSKNLDEVQRTGSYSAHRISIETLVDIMHHDLMSTGEQSL